MIHSYDPEQPLVSVHVPKCAGSSFHLQVLQPWFGDRLYLHYLDERTNTLPPVYDAGPGSCIHGHFNHTRGCGVATCYPGIRQQITVLRDPFELHLSNYFYVRRLGDEARRAGKAIRVHDTLEEYLEKTSSFLLEHLPAHLCEDNYTSVLDDTYLWIGVSEQLQESVGLLARRLGFPVPLTGAFNESVREQPVPDGAREYFEDKHPLEMAIYRYARQRLDRELGRAVPEPAGPGSLPECIFAGEEALPEDAISVIVPCHNDEDYLETCLHSLLEQTLQPDEIIICDDASLDRTRDIANHFARQYPGRVRCVFHEENRGCGGNFNSGIQAARGRYVSLVAADDYWLPGKLEREFGALQETGYRWAYSRVELVWEDGPHAGQKAPFWGTQEGHDGNLFEDVLLRRVSPRSFLIERKLLLEAAGFDEAFGMYEDWDLKLRLSARYPAAFVAGTGAVYRQHGQGISRSDPQRQLAEAGKVLRKNNVLIEQYAAGRSGTLRELAWQKLLPGHQDDREIPACLSMAYVPRRLTRRGEGLVIFPAETKSRLLESLVSHPDLLVTTTMPVDSAMWTGLLTKVKDDAVAGDMVRAALYAAWRRQLEASGRSRLLLHAPLTGNEVIRLHELFPDATFVAADRKDMPETFSDAAQLIVTGVDNRVSALDSLCVALGLPRLPASAQSEMSATDKAAQLIAQGEKHFAAGDLDTAEASFREALRCDRASADACNNLAVVQWQRGNLAAALELLSQGLVLDSRHLDLLENSARILFESGHYDDSEIFCKQYLAVNPANSGMVGLLSQVKRAAG